MNGDRIALLGVTPQELTPEEKALAEENIKRYNVLEGGIISAGIALGRAQVAAESLGLGSVTMAGALKAFDYAIKYQVEAAILKEKSPSCGFRYIYNGDFNSTLVNGEGLFAYLLKKHNVKILTEDDFKEEKKNETN